MQTWTRRIRWDKINPTNRPIDWLTNWLTYLLFCLLVFFAQTVEKLKIELVKSKISIIAIEGFDELGDVSFQMEKLKVNS